MAQVQRGMLPIGELMIEHRLIDRMLALMRIELDRIGAYGKADPEFIDSAVAFVKEYADICHHGKEEKILFARLAEKRLTPEMKKMVEDLVQEHRFVRDLTNDLVRAKDQYMNNRPEGKPGIISCLNSIVEFYPRHVEKEEKHFFIPAMDYFSDDEKETMLRMFREFDARLFHDEFRMMVSGMEDRWKPPSA
jgi:hemerythrin-like domain-containing protein